MQTLLWMLAVVFSLSAILGSGMVRGASHVVWLAYWGGVLTMIAIWYTWAHWNVAVG